MSVLQSSLFLSIRKNIDFNMSQSIRQMKTAYKAKLSINKDTSFDILYDVYDSNHKNYLYIKMDENTANSPFFYNRSYELSELHDLNRIFRTCEKLQEVKEYLKDLFMNNKIKLKYKENEDILTLELDTILFITPIKIELDLYREMVPEAEKDEKLLCLYSINKEKLAPLRKIYSLILKNKNDEKSKKLIEIFENYDIPGIEH